MFTKLLSFSGELFYQILACVAGGSAKLFAEAANSLAVEAREGIFASGEAGSEIPACLISYPF